MYRIAILSENRGQLLSDWTRAYFFENGVFPQIEIHKNAEHFFYDLNALCPCGIIVDLPGVAGLNAAEHLRSLYPGCSLIWCSDLDFSLQAYRLRAEYFMMAPVSESQLREGLSAWMERKQRRRV